MFSPGCIRLSSPAVLAFLLQESQELRWKVLLKKCILFQGKMDLLSENQRFRFVSHRSSLFHHFRYVTYISGPVPSDGCISSRN
jgi:hypothetical protein